MKVEAQVIYAKGRGVAAGIRKTMSKYRGQLTIGEVRIHALSRNSMVANIVSITDGAEAPMLPPLHDANVIYIDKDTMRIRGFEVVEGAHYAQTWEVKVL